MPVPNSVPRQPRVAATSVELDALRAAVRARSGFAMRYVREVEPLRMAVQVATGNVLAAATLKRFFGLVATDSGTARFTLDTLAAYVCPGTDWNQFVRQQRTAEAAAVAPEATVYASVVARPRPWQRWEAFSTASSRALTDELARAVLLVQPPSERRLDVIKYLWLQGWRKDVTLR